ncbi:MAG: AAA family ATPase [Gallionella sp.]|nr:AAA family ATPase [Gallionella sp.]
MQDTKVNNYEVIRNRCKPLADRIADELAQGYSLHRIVTEAELYRIGGASYGSSVERLRTWLENPISLRGESRYVGELSVAEELERRLEAWFAQLDDERAAAQSSVPAFIETAVSRKIWSSFEQARELCELMEISAPPGTGKTQAIQPYLARCRKREGFKCPVWVVTLSEFSLSLKAVLQLIADEVHPDRESGGRKDDDFAIKRMIEERTEGRGGLLIVDEAQHIGDADKLHGIRVLNGLRYFTDRKLFGIAFLSNGEIYRRVAGGKHGQLSSRMEAARVEIKGVPDEDVDLIMAAHGIGGKPAREWCIKKAKGVGGLRALTRAFVYAKREFGEVNHQTLAMLGRL